jgi:outer membrane protein OmpA-like peptidoglycan-associated protein
MMKSILMMNNKILSLVFILSCFIGANAQQREVRKLTHEKRHKMAHELVNKGSYYNAIDHLKDLVKEHPDNIKYLTRLADAYFYSRDYRNSEECYGKLVNLNSKDVTVCLYKYAESLKYNEKYLEARNAYKAFSISKYKEKSGEKYRLFAKNEIASCDWAIKNSEKKSPVDVIHLGDHVNSGYSEFSPTLMNDTTLLFASLQSDTVISVAPDESHTFHVKLLASKKQEDGWGPHTELPEVNSIYESNANGTFSVDGKKFYFTRCLPNEKGEMICAIYTSEFVEGQFSKPVKLGKDINKKNYTSTQPNIAMVSSGKKKYEVLYFASNRPGGKGGLDIYYSTINKDGTLTLPVNIGPVINTIRDEITPYYDKEGNLYFSSNYHYGFGGYDVFKSKGGLNKWEKPSNIGKPFNSRVDDTYYNMDTKTNEGFIVSNRPEGYHLKSETCCDDIYAVKFKNPFLLQVNAFNISDKKKISNVNFAILSRPAVNNFYAVEFDTVPEPVLTDSLQQSAMKIDSLSADSIKTVNAAKMASNKSALVKKNQNTMLSYLSGNKYDTTGINTLIDKDKYLEIAEADNLYNISNQNEYLIRAIFRKDTSYFTFITDKNKQDVANYYRFDTISGYEAVNTDKLDLLKVNLFFDGDTLDEVIAMVVDTTKVILEDEKQFTVTKVIEDIKKHKTKDLRIILNYDFDDTKFIEKHSGSLDSLVTLLKDLPLLNIHIDAHTDNKGTEHYNIDLSKRRVKSIENYLVSKGITKTRMTGEGHGEIIPLVPNTNPDGSDSPENRYLNRRAEIIILE